MNADQGVIINGAIRDSAEIAKLPIGCKALGTIPLKSEKKVPGTTPIYIYYPFRTFSELKTKQKAIVFCFVTPFLRLSEVFHPCCMVVFVAFCFVVTTVLHTLPYHLIPFPYVFHSIMSSIP